MEIPETSTLPIEDYEALVLSDRQPRQPEQTTAVPTLLDAEDAEAIERQLTEARDMIASLLDLNRNKDAQIAELESAFIELQRRSEAQWREIEILQPKADELDAIKRQKRLSQMQQSRGFLQKIMDEALAYRKP